VIDIRAYDAATADRPRPSRLLPEATMPRRRAALASLLAVLAVALPAVVVTDTTVDLSWSEVAGAVGYHAYRDGWRVTTTLVAATAYTDAGLTPATSYGYAVSGVDQDGLEGQPSAVVIATTTGEPAACVTASNYQHTVDGRAYVLFGLTYARGSNQYMRLWNVFVTHTLHQTGPDHWVIADGQC
jgi:hypothetical protein